jgi:Tfp pilus assembly protein PilZ
MAHNRRADPRIRAGKIVVRVSNDEELQDRYLRDLSRGGLFVVTDNLAPVGSSVEVELFPTGWKEPLVLRGQVVRVADDEIARSLNSVGVGIRLDDLPEYARARLDALIAQVGAMKLTREGPISGMPPPPPAPASFSGMMASMASPRMPPTPPEEAILPGPFTPPPSSMKAAVTPGPFMPPPPVIDAPPSSASIPMVDAELVSEPSHPQPAMSGDARLAEAEAVNAVNSVRIRELEAELTTARDQSERMAQEREAAETQRHDEVARLEEELEELRSGGGSKRRLLPWLIAASSLGLSAVLLVDPPPLRPLRDRIDAVVSMRGREQQVEPPPPVTPEPVVEAPVAQVEVDAGVAQEVDAGAVAVAPPPDPPAISGILNLRSNRTALVSLNGERIGKTPMLGFAARPGKYKVQFDCFNARGKVTGQAINVSVTAGSTLEIENRCGQKPLVR